MQSGEPMREVFTPDRVGPRKFCVIPLGATVKKQKWLDGAQEAVGGVSSSSLCGIGCGVERSFSS